MATPRLGQIPEHIWQAILTEAAQGSTPEELVAIWGPTVQQRFGIELTWDAVATRFRREELRHLPEPPNYDPDALIKWLEETWAQLTQDDITSMPPGGALGFLDKRCPNRPRD